MSRRTRQRAVGAHVALPAAYAAMLLTGTAAAALHGRFSATSVLVTVAIIVTATSAAAEPRAAPLPGLAGSLTAGGFSRPPYAQLRPTGPLAAHVAVTLAACSPVAAGTGMLVRHVMSSGGRAELLEHARGEWVRIAASGDAPQASASTRVSARQGLVLAVAGQPRPAAAGRIRRPGRRRARPGTAAHPGRPGRGVRRGQAAFFAHEDGGGRSPSRPIAA